jgi:hypothetical protein
VSRLRRLFTTPLVAEHTTPQLIRAVLTGVGVFTFLFGTFGLQYLGPTRVEMILALLLLGVFAMASAGLGHLVVIADLLERQTEPRAAAEPAADTAG